MGYKTVRVFAPASVSNLCVGFDILGFALEKPGDEVLIREGKAPGLKITKIKSRVPLSKEILKNTASFGAYLLLKELGLLDLPVEMELHKYMAIGTGLGSSAASAVAGVFAMNEYLGQVKSRQELLSYAIQAEKLSSGEEHGDNVAPSLLGGLVLVKDLEKREIVKLPVPKGLCCAVIHPKIEVLTKASRNILSKHVSLSDHTRQASHLAAFIHSLYTSDFKLMSSSLLDFIIEPQRKKLIPHFDEMKQIANDLGCIAFGISGSGPSVFALCNNTLIAENTCTTIRDFLREKNIVSNTILSAINQQGAFRY